MYPSLQDGSPLPAEGSRTVEKTLPGSTRPHRPGRGGKEELEATQSSLRGTPRLDFFSDEMPPLGRRDPASSDPRGLGPGARVPIGHPPSQLREPGQVLIL